MLVSDGVLQAMIGQEIVFLCNSPEMGTNLATKLVFKRNGNIFSVPKLYSNSITILALTNETGVEYECEAQNDVGFNTSNKISLDIHCKFK